MNIPRETFAGKWTLVSGPAVEPVSLAQAKKHLRVDFDDDDDEISELITVARLRAESHLDRAFVTQTWDYSIEAFPLVTNDDLLWKRVQNAIVVPKARLQSVASVKYVDWNGDTQTLVEGTNYLSRTGDPGAVYPFPVTRVWPYTRYQLDAVTVRVVLGYGDAADDVPATVRHAIKLLIGHYYENREAVADAGLAEIPLGVRNLLDAESWGCRP